MVASLDGFIAKDDNDLSWMQSTDAYEKGTQLTEDQITEFVNSIDCYVMGATTYEHALQLGWVYGDTPVVVVTNRDLETEKPSVRFYGGDLSVLVTELKSKYSNIWMVGGAVLTKAFLQQDLADEIVYTIMPVLLGKGLLFFDFIGKEKRLHLKDTTAYNDGMVELTYEVIKEQPL